MDRFSDIVIDVLLDAGKDTLYLVPFLLVTYLAMEWLEHRTNKKTQEIVRHAGAAGPIMGALAGVIPQCGFSAAAATLWAGRVITLGTLFAVFLSTSDEMLPIFIAEQVPLPVIFKILGAKLAVGMIMGFMIDAGMRFAHRLDSSLHIHDLCEREHCCCHGGKGGILKSSLKHTLQVALFIFLVSLILDAIMTVVGADALSGFLAENQMLSVFGSALVGLIPNCAASVVIAQLYVEGVLGSGALFAGLLVSAGVGLLVLVRSNRSWRENLVIVAGLYVIGVLWGLAVNAFGIVF